MFLGYQQPLNDTGRLTTLAIRGSVATLGFQFYAACVTRGLTTSHAKGLTASHVSRGLTTGHVSRGLTTSHNRLV